MPTSCLWICYRVCDVCVALTHLVFRYDWRFSCREDLSKRSVLFYDIRAQTQVRKIFAIFQLHFYNLWYFGIITKKNTHWKVFTMWRKLQKWNWINQFFDKMRVFTIFRALFVRSLFGAHGLIAIWRLYMVIGEIWCWYLSVTLLGLLIETVVTLAVKRGKEWKWYVVHIR